ncbi:SDR family oxidoreductase [Streptomyces californicus]|uniref:SDR family oxidoreductase n=1 Tax=Streptomyces californicus TaxID=67351 RepID=UPI0036FA4494
MFDFSGRTVLITGGARGFGRELARMFTAAGAQVVINYFHGVEQAERLREELPGARFVRASVAKPEQVRKMFDEVHAAYGGLDVLVNNAATGAAKPGPALTERDWQLSFDTNVHGARWCMEAAAPLLRAHGGGVVVNLSSMGAFQVCENYASVGPTKAAIEALTRYYAFRYAPDGIRVVTAAACLLDSDIAFRMPGRDRIIANWRAATPAGRLGTLREFGNVVLFLASPEASWINGTTVLADGGATLSSVPAWETPGRAPHLTLAPRADEPIGTWTEPPPIPSTPAPSTGARPESRPDVRHDPSPLPMTPAPREEPANGAEALPPPPETPAPARPRPVRRAPAAAPGGEIAIVGMDLLAPGASGTEEFWRVLVEGEPQFGEPDPRRFDTDSFYRADRDQPGYHTRSWGIVDTKQDEDAGRDYAVSWLRRLLTRSLTDVSRTDDDRFAFMATHTASTCQHLEEAHAAAAWRLYGPERLRQAGLRHLSRGADRPHLLLPHVLGSQVVDGLLPAGTEQLIFDTACSSSLYALDAGVRRLRDGRCDIAVCAAATCLVPYQMIALTKSQAVTRSGLPRPFDRRVDGTLFSDGAAVLVLKTLERAHADGDRVHGVLHSLGVSCDGRGKAIFAPNPRGQRLAVQRAFDTGAVSRDKVGLVVAHATGTSAGDAAELETLRSEYAGCRPWITSAKSVIGHTGETAGMISVIHALLAMEHGEVPAQGQFQEPKPEYGLDQGSLRVPTRTEPWPAPRTATVSALGFGGTDAHAVLRQDTGTPLSVPRRHSEEDIVLVGWNAELPGAPDTAAVTAWLTGTGPAPNAGYGAEPPVPSVREITVPPAQLRAWDRTHIMTLKAAVGLRDRLGDTWTKLAERTGVIAGHLGASAHQAAYSVQARLPDLERHVVDDASRDEFNAFQERALGQAPPMSVHTAAGIMANVIPARISGYLDLRGLNLTVDAGQASTFAALSTASDYLRTGDLDFALVVGVNGNSLPESREVLRHALDRPDATLAEGAFVLALTRRDTAVREGLEVLATLGGPDLPDQVDLARSAIPGRTYLAADSAIAVLKAVLGGRPVTIGHTDPVGGHRRTCTITPAGGSGPTPPPSRAESGPQPVARYRQTWVAAPAVPAAAPPPSNDTLLLAPADWPPPGVLSPAGATVLRPDDPLPDHDFRHIRLLAPAGAEHQPGGDRFPALLTVHELLFAACRRNAGHLESVGVALPDGMLRGRPRPAAGLFTGFVKGMVAEFPSLRACCLLSTDRDPGAALDRLAAELAQPEPPSVIGYDAGTRLVPALRRAPERLPTDRPADAAPTLGPDSVVLAVGGARGVGARLLAALAAEADPTVFVLGSNDLSGVDARVLSEDDAAFAARRAAMLRDRPPSTPLSETLAEADRLRRARLSAAGMAALGPKAHYLVCDVTDADAVARAVKHIGATPDLVLFDAGLYVGSMLGRKTTEEFRRVRDVKTLGYHHLRRAFGSRRPARWISMSSLAGVTGQAGSVDYCSANDFLNTAAEAGTDETSLCWPMWDEVGICAEPMLRSFMERTTDGLLMALPAGTALFLEELRHPSSAPVIAYASEATLAGFRRRLPHADVGDEPAVELSVDLAGQSFLTGHIVLGRPTLPGMVSTEWAGRVAAALVPGSVPIAFEHLEFRRRVGEVPVRLTARLLAPDRAEVLLSAPVRTPDGVVLDPERVHYRMEVVLGAAPPAPPRWTPAGPAPTTPFPTAYYQPNPYVHLHGVLHTLADVTIDGDRAAARYVGADLPGFTRPVMLLDALVQLRSVVGTQGPALPVAVERVRTFPGGPAERLWCDAAEGLCRAVDKDGNVVAELRGLRTGRALCSWEPFGRPA